MRKYSVFLVIAILVCVFIFWKSIVFGYIPFPGGYLVSFYEPWKSVYTRNGVPLIPHKAVMDDVFRQLYQYKVLAADMLKNGQLPLWNPYNGSGMPLMAVMHAGFLNPLIGLFIIFPSWLAWTVFIGLQSFCLMLGIMWYTRKLGMGYTASLFSAVTFITSGFVTVRYLFGEYLYIAACLPILLGLVESVNVNNQRKSIYAIPFVVAFMVFSGHPQMIFYVLATYLVYAILRLRRNKRIILKICILTVLGLGISAIQLLASIELYRLSNMTQSASGFVTEKFLLPLSHLLTIVIPGFFGNQATYNYWGHADFVETAAWIGTLPLLFVSVSIIAKNRGRFVWVFFICLFLVSLFLTLRSPFTEWIYKIPIPIFSTGIPSRIYFLTTFGLSILAGFGMESWLEDRSITNRLLYITVIYLCILGIVSGVLLYFMKSYVPCPSAQVPECYGIALRNTFIQIIALCIAGMGFFVRTHMKHYRIFYILPVGILMLQFILGLYTTNKFIPFSSKGLLFPSLPIIDAIREITGTERIVGYGDARISPNIASALRFYDPNYYDPLYIKRYGELASYANTGTADSQLARSDVSISFENDSNDIRYKRHTRFAQISAIQYMLFKREDWQIIKRFGDAVWEDKDWFLVRLKNISPHANIVEKFEVLQNNTSILNRLFDDTFDPASSVIVEQNPPVTSDGNTLKLTSDVNILEYLPNSVDMEVNASKASFLILADNYYPGWRAYIDNGEIPIYRANYSFRSVFVPAGQHNVRFVYKPESVGAGFIISVFSVCILIVYLLQERRIIGLR